MLATISRIIFPAMIPAKIFELIVMNSRDAVLIASPDATPIFANAAANALFSMDEAPELIIEFVSRLRTEADESIVKYRNPEEQLLWLDCHRQTIEMDGRQCCLITCRDITFEKQQERRLQKEATTDFLSGLANRREFHKVLEANCSRPICVAVIDVDHFKQINDQRGHLIGDAAIRFVAEQMLKSFFDAVCVARLGGEEFGVIVDATVEDVAGKFEDFRKSLERRPFSEHDICLTVSIGLALSNDVSDGHTLLECADKAVYESKHLGRNRLTVFELRGV